MLNQSENDLNVINADPDPDWLMSKRVELLYSQGPNAIFGALFAAVSLGILSTFYLPNDATKFWPWLSIHLFIIFTRFSLILIYKRNKQKKENYRKWILWFNITLSLYAVTWPALFIYAIPVDNIIFSGFAIICLCAIVSASVAIYSINLRTCTLFSSLSFLPVCLYYVFLIDDFNLTVLGLLGLIYYLFLAAVAWRLNKIIHRTFEEQTVNLKLIDILTKEKQQIEKLTEKLITLSTQDGLTSIPNRRFFDEFLTKEWSRSLRFKTPLSLIICDLDSFKNYNDHYGHQKGDQTLCEIAHLLEEFSRRGGDMAARYGGEEFAIILPSTNLNNAEHVAEQIRVAISDLKIPHEASEIADHITCSFGVASVIPDRDKEKEKLIEAADKALYEAKKEGKNRTKVSYAHL